MFNSKINNMIKQQFKTLLGVFDLRTQKRKISPEVEQAHYGAGKNAKAKQNRKGFLASLRFSRFSVCSILVILFLLIAPLTSFAISSGSYVIIDGGTDASHHSSTSSNYQLEGSVEYMVGRGASTNYEEESGSVTFGNYCGDGEINGTESCDGSNLNGKDCTNCGVSGCGTGYTGTLACTATCTFDTSGCSAPGGGGGGGGGGAKPSTPTFDSSITDRTITYLDSMLFYGTKQTTATYVYVNGSREDVTYPTSSKWQKTVSLDMGENTITIKARNNYGYSDERTHTLTRRMIGDANDDGNVDDYDFSLLANHWSEDWQEADFNGDNIVDDYDLSLMVAYWTA